MGTMIFLKDNIILDTSGGVISGLCFSVEKIIYEQKLKVSKDLTELIDYWSISYGFMPFDIADFIYTKEDLFAFTDLMRKGIDRFYQENPGLPQYTIDNLENFYKALVEAQKTFPQ